MVFWLLKNNNYAILKTFRLINGGLLKEKFYFKGKKWCQVFTTADT